MITDLYELPVHPGCRRRGGLCRASVCTDRRKPLCSDPCQQQSSCGRVSTVGAFWCTGQDWKPFRIGLCIAHVNITIKIFNQG